MYRIEDSDVVSAINSDSRTFRAKLKFDDGNVLSGVDVGKITTDHAQSDDDTLQIGGVLARHVQIKLYSSRLPKKGDVFRLYLYLLDRSGESAEPATCADLTQWKHSELAMLTHRQISLLGSTKDPDGVPLNDCMIPMGEFVITRVRTQGCEAVLECYDKLAQEKVYTPDPELVFPANAADVVDDIITQLGIPGHRQTAGGYLKTNSGEYVLTASSEKILTSAEYSFTIANIPEGAACREVLGWIAAMHGGNGITDREGYYTTLFFSSAKHATIMSHTDEPEYDDATDKSSERYVYVRGLICVVDEETTLTAGVAAEDDPHTVEFTCPYMTQQRLDDILAKFRGIPWPAGRFTERLGDPRRDMGDLVVPEPYHEQMLISSLTYRFDGGLSAEIESCGNEEAVYG